MNKNKNKKPFFQTKVGSIIKLAGNFIAPGLINTLEGVGSIGEAIQRVRTSTEGTPEDRIKLEQLIIDADAQEQQEITGRWKSDAMSDSWWSKSIRPLSLAWLHIVIFVLAILASVDWGITIADSWVELYKWSYLTMLGAYTGFRGVEKIMSSKK